jgi:hypothetical protein
MLPANLLAEFGTPSVVLTVHDPSRRSKWMHLEQERTLLQPRCLMQMMIRSSSPSSSLLVPNAPVEPTKTFVLHPSLRLQVSEIAS